ncbi:dehydrogenase/reductase SDR family member 9-like [Limulus polyphemus]|uniref:Dehydrogenase/reductase SDR family member 9-like n=1 Tax=Limulus polyphemus TaxID=6850 RepID=A0ABM1SLG4_LIMPO|nr:dehydrogenase/reductase SDR family member 9-like [Limulus polyphemus]
MSEIKIPESLRETYVVKNFPAIVVVTVMSTILLNYVWNGKIKKRKVNDSAVLITDCDSGFGWECARRLDRLGFHVFAGFRNPQEDRALRLQAKASRNLQLVQLDVTNNEEVKNAARFVQERLPPGITGLHSLINVSRDMLHGHFDWYTSEQCQRIIDANLTGVVRVTKCFLHLLKPIPGRIINISSINGKFPLPEMSVYTAANFGLEGFTKSLRHDLKPMGIKVTVIIPGEVSRSSFGVQCQKEDMEIMWEEMNESNKRHYEQFFKEWRRRMQDSLRKENIVSRKLLKIFLVDLEDALFSKNPQDQYVSVTDPFRTVLRILKILPSCFRHKVVRLLTGENKNTRKKTLKND